jgi:hypothetical protein
MTYVDHPASTPVIPVPLFEEERQSDGRHSFTYLLLFPVVGLFFAIISLALTPTEWLPDSGTAACTRNVDARWAGCPDNPDSGRTAES